MAKNGHEIEGHMTPAAQAVILEAQLFAVKLEMIAETSDDARLADLSIYMAGHVSKTGKLAELTINTQAELIAYLNHMLEGLGNRIKDLESGRPGAKSRFRRMVEATLQWPMPKLPKWPEWSMPSLLNRRTDETLQQELRDAKALISTLSSRLDGDSDTLLALDRRLQVLYRWELDEIAAPRGTIPQSPRLQELEMALIEVANARSECDKVRDQS